MGCLGSTLKALGFILFIFFGIWGTYVSLKIVYLAAGFWAVVIGFALFPVVITAAPWYALVAWETWAPLIIVYGGGLLAAILYGTGSYLSGD